jgi:ABC-type Fe3+-hydroxamate transport system substrate-binding protein
VVRAVKRDSAPARAPRRIVSLVPSLTEALFALGLGERVVAVTDWCVHPADGVARLPRLGGTKNPDLDRIVALRPDLVIANHEENTRRDVERLAERGVEVWVTYPRTLRDGAALLRELAGLGAREDAIRDVVEPVEDAIAALDADPPAHRVRVFCPIWKDPWMAVGGDTFAGDLLAACGGENVFARRGDRRYPKVRESDIVAAAPEVIVLPDEPYAFGPAEARALGRLDVPAARTGRIHLIDGTLVSWYGPRIRTAIETLRPLLAELVAGEVAGEVAGGVDADVAGERAGKDRT